MDCLRSNQRVRFPLRILCVTGPGMFPGMFNHPGPHRVQLDVSVTAKEVALLAHQAGTESPLPQGAGTSVGAVNGLDISLAQLFHHLRRPLAILRCQQKVDVVGHQHIGVEFDCMLAACLTEMVEVKLTIVLREETDATVVAPLNDVKGNSGKRESGPSGHGRCDPALASMAQAQQKNVVRPLFYGA